MDKTSAGAFAVGKSGKEGGRTLSANVASNGIRVCVPPSMAAFISARVWGARAQCLKGGVEAADKAGIAGECRSIRPDDGQRQKMPVVATEPRQESRAQKGGFARARGPENDQKTRGRGFSEAPETVEGLDNRRLTAKEDAGVFGL